MSLDVRMLSAYSGNSETETVKQNKDSTTKGYEVGLLYSVQVHGCTRHSSDKNIHSEQSRCSCSNTLKLIHIYESFNIAYIYSELIPCLLSIRMLVTFLSICACTLSPGGLGRGSLDEVKVFLRYLLDEPCLCAGSLGLLLSSKVPGHSLNSKSSFFLFFEH